MSDLSTSTPQTRHLTSISEITDGSFVGSGTEITDVSDVSGIQLVGLVVADSISDLSAISEVTDE